MLRAMCDVKLMDRKSTKDLMNMIGLTALIEMTVKANALQWFGLVLRTEKNSALKVVLDFEVLGKRKRGRPKSTWRGKVKENLKIADLNEEDAFNCTKWRRGVWTLKIGVIRVTSVDEDNTG